MLRQPTKHENTLANRYTNRQVRHFLKINKLKINGKLKIEHTFLYKNV